MLATAAPVTGGLQVPPGLVAISFQVCLTEAVEGFVQPGSEVVVFDLANGPGKSGTSLSDAPVCSGSHSQGGPLTISVVLARVKILAVGQTVPAPAVPGATPAPTPTTGGAGASQSSQMVPITVAVSQADAEKLMALTESGIPYLGLINATSPGSTVSSSTSTVRP
jgi:pilus assembly protein CpaB